VTGYETIGRIGRSITTPDFSSRGLHPSSFVTPFGAAAAVAKLLKLNMEQNVYALAIAGNLSSGLLEFANSGT
jgi:2-methylcitrate dehydratase PrpD